jgi:DNA repair photolyase
MAGLRPISNPPNPWLSTELEYLDEIPDAQLSVYEDHTREILSSNDSPDVGFNWSVNPYRGCFHSCAYCVSGDTRVLMSDGRQRPIRNVRVGDEIYGTVIRGRYRRYARTTVAAHWSSAKRAFRIRLADGTEILASADHRFLSERGWKHVTGAEQGSLRRPFLTTGNSLLGTGFTADDPNHSDAYKEGYLCGLIRGDGMLGRWSYDWGTVHQFRLALVDDEPLVRAQDYLRELEIHTSEFAFAAASGNRRALNGIRASSRFAFEMISTLCEWPDESHPDWSKGFLAGIFDAEGSYSGGCLRFSNTDPEIISQIWNALVRFGFEPVVEGEPRGHGCTAAAVRVRGGLKEHLRFFHTVDPAITRKRDLEGQALKSEADLRVVSIEDLGITLPMFDITTGTGDFIANGVVSHNCYARPTHEYLGFGAGTDFDRKITVKPDAPRLLREAFERPSWTGELIVFSGVTDCYQPLEASYRLTRQCLEVCAAYKNPVGIITKAPLIERDLDVLQELHRVASVGVTLSVPIWDREHAHAVEPFVATPQRRIKTIERLSAAGLDVGVNIAPVIPGLSDADIPQILEAAHAAGARRAGFVFLRLPGSVAQVFEERIRAALPLRAERILSRVREARGGKLYDSRFGIRGRGQGNYAEAARALFDTTVRRLGMNEDCHGRANETFQRPGRGRQLPLL